MLGKGLESLIPPQKGNGSQGNGSSSGGNNSSAPQDGQQHPAHHHSRDAQGNPEPQIIPIDIDAEIEEMDVLEPDPEPPAPVYHPVPAAPVQAHVPLAAPISTHQASPAQREPVGEPRKTDSIYHIEIEKIRPNPHQPRKTFDEQAIRDLAASIREFGFIQPLVVSKIQRETPEGVEVAYQLIAGERRLLAAKSLGLERVPAIIRKVDTDFENLELAVIENLQRENLNPIEMARAFARLQEEFRMTQREIASKLGKSREVVANTLRLLDLPPAIQEAVEKGRISESHGRLLLTIGDPAAQQALFDDLLRHGLTIRELKNRVRIAQPKLADDMGAELDPELKQVQERLSSELGAPVKISHSGETGKITISFYSKEELESIL